MPIHVRAEPGDYADAVLLPGDPLRQEGCCAGAMPGHQMRRPAARHASLSAGRLGPTGRVSSQRYETFQLVYGISLALNRGYIAACG